MLLETNCLMFEDIVNFCGKMSLRKFASTWCRQNRMSQLEKGIFPYRMITNLVILLFQIILIFLLV